MYVCGNSGNNIIIIILLSYLIYTYVEKSCSKSVTEAFPLKPKSDLTD